ncbi:MAG: hypothetical protein K6U74_04630 [Firmicutes bacterium]|nr:hypothetical protein [Bacillota bacterium]
MKKKKKRPSLAPGMKGILEKSAGKKQKEQGETTRVTHLSHDEVDPS